MQNFILIFLGVFAVAVSLLMAYPSIGHAGSGNGVENRTAGAMPEEHPPLYFERQQRAIRHMDHCALRSGNRYTTHRSQFRDLKPQWRTQWDADQWDTAYLAETWTGSTFEQPWTSDRALESLFKNGFFEQQYMCANQPYLRVGAPFFDLSHQDRHRALNLLAGQTGVLDEHRRFVVYSAAHGEVIGTFGAHGFHAY